DLVQVVLTRVPPCQLQPRVVQRALHLKVPGRGQVPVEAWVERAAVKLHGRDHRLDAVRRYFGGAGAVGDVGRDLERGPKPRGAREHEAVKAEVEHLLHGTWKQ